MAPRSNAARTPAPAPAPAPVPTAVASVTTKTVNGFAISLTAFIPVDQKDLRKQAEIPLLLLDIQEGKKTIADLIPFLKQQEFRQQHVRKRVPEDEFAALFAVAAPPPPAEETKEPAGTIGGAQMEGDDEPAALKPEATDGDEEEPDDGRAGDHIDEE